jgi:hypothetical protein
VRANRYIYLCVSVYLCVCVSLCTSLSQSFAPVSLSTPRHQTSYWRQAATLFHRSMLTALRDPALYYLQMFLHIGFGFIVGAAFFQLKPTMQRPDLIMNGITWLVFMQTFVHIFKVCDRVCVCVCVCVCV